MTKKAASKFKKDTVYLGIDHGGTNIGVAVGKNSFTQPIKIIGGANQERAVQELTRTAMESQAYAFVLGLPLTADGKETAQSLKVRHFAKLLKIVSKKPVIFCNENGTSNEAFDSLLEQGASKKRRLSSDDVAAALILKRFFQDSCL